MHASCGNWFHEFSALGPCKLIGGRAIGEEGGPAAVFIVSLVLKFLSSRLGTLLLSGWICVDWKWPFVHSFSELSLKKREAILQKWSRETFLLPLRIAFLLLKIMCLFVFFSWTDENSSNPAWEAIGYQVEAIERETKREKERPLEKGIIEIMNEDELSLKESLVQKGIDVAEDENENVYKIKCDVVIIGSGCGGGVAAAVLAKSGQKVLILEKGHYFVPEDYSGLEGPAFSELYESGGMLTTLDGKIMVMAGTAKRDKKGTDSTWLVDAVKNGAVILTGCKAETLMLVSDKKEKDRKRCLGVIAAAENKNIRKKLQIEARATVSACESLVELKGKSFEGGILTSLHKVQSEQESDIQAIVEAAALGPASFAALFPWASRRDMNDRMTKYARTAVLFALARDHGSGEKWALSEAMDRGLGAKGLNEDLEEFLDTVTAVGGPRSRSEYWTLYCSAHQMGSCRIGANEEDGAVDENGECWEAKGLFVCDGSVLPSAVGVNPMITIQSTAYCISKRLADSLKEGKLL
ncbi:UNVERIFIED_CONTAM: Long-chain-alcohol oxidase FAO2 [Sesamum radiatum]|uniref:Long-chain-alcohol oxidase FAO2 n=1 Tax=Sesamum radiatum TaxID=300843 RepID=A0AAW2USH2_SESRA